MAARHTTEKTENKPVAPWCAIIDGMPDAAVALSSSGLVLHHNSSVAQIFPKVRTHQPLSYFNRHPDLISGVEKAWTANAPVVVYLQERIPVERRIMATISRLALNPVDAAETNAPRMLVTFRDLSEQDMLERMRSDFVANASHELRTPLASLMGYVETLRNAAQNDVAARDRFLVIMWEQAERMTRLIDDLLSLSRVEMRSRFPPQGNVDLNKVAAEVVQALDPVARASGITVELITPLNEARVLGDREELVQVTQNLLQNAIKYGRRNGRIEVSIAREIDQELARTPRIELSVKDDGHGIAAQHLPRLTERFYRVNKEASRAHGGTGLGLAIVKHIVMRHRGELKIASDLGKGSTFKVLLDAY